jgi:hypothetical protein
MEMQAAAWRAGRPQPLVRRELGDFEEDALGVGRQVIGRSTKLAACRHALVRHCATQYYGAVVVAIELVAPAGSVAATVMVCGPAVA